MNGIFIVPTVRCNLLLGLLDSIERSRYCQWDLAVFFQAYTQAELEFVSLHPMFKRMAYTYYTAGLTPPFQCRYKMFGDVAGKYDAYISLDDDMELWEERTDFQPAIEKAQERDAGIVSCNWVRTKSPALISRARYEPGVFIEQALVYMGGGMVFDNKVIEATLLADNLPYLFDDVQYALIAYLAGYRNYRYLGSMLFHHIMSTGGIKRLYSERALVLPNENYITVRPCAQIYDIDNNYFIPKPKDLTAAAHVEHNINRERMAAQSQ